MTAASPTPAALPANQNARKRGPKPKKEPTTSPKVSSKQQQLLQQQQRHQQALQAQQAQHRDFLSGLVKPTILTMDSNSQIIIDFNQTDSLLCTYCEYTINNLNYMRTHIKYKHKSSAITFKNTLTSKYYTIVEWPLTPVPTLTPAANNTASTTTPATPGDGNSTNQLQNQQQQQQLQQQQQQAVPVAANTGTTNFAENSM